MSLMSFTGKQRNLLDETPEHCRQLKLPHPILTNEDIERLRTRRPRAISRWRRCRRCSTPTTSDPAEALARALDELVDAAEQAIARRGVAADRQRPRRLARARRRSPACWPPAALHHGLLRAAAAERGGHRRRKRRAARGDALLPAVRLRGQRGQSLPGLRGDPASSTPTAICPRDVELDQLADQYITAVKKGILKTMSKMGISTLRSYHAAQQFEAIGLDREVVDAYFTGTASRIERRRPGRDRPRGAGPAPRRLRAARRRARWSWTSAASTSSGSTARSTSGTRRRSRGCSMRCINNDPRSLRRVRPGGQRPEPRAVHAARAVRVRARRAGAARRGRAGRRDRQAILHRGDVARLDQQGGPRDAGHRHEPAGRHVEHGRGRRGPGALPAAARRRFGQLRHQAGGQRPVRRDDRVPGQRQDACRSRWPRGPSRAKAASCPATR